jgi:Ca2+-binding EF-hand superfamily protein
VLSELQREKLTRLFQLMDTDDNGLMEWSDVDRTVARLIESRGWEADSDGARSLRAGHMEVWQQVEPFATDGALSLDGFIAYHEDMLSVPGAYDASVGPLADLVFSTLDADGDGQITLEEHRAFCRIYGIDPLLADTIFPMWDTDGNGYVSTEELAVVVREFFHSTDPESPGNWLFGPLAHPVEEGRQAGADA